MLNRSKLLAASLILGTFVAGGAVGSVISDAWGNDDGGRSQRGRDGGRERRPYSERLGDALDMTTAQRESVSVILQRRQDGLRQIWEETQPRYDSLRMEIRQDIADLLVDEQRTTFEEMIARSDSSRAARERDDDNRGDSRGRRHDW